MSASPEELGEPGARAAKPASRRLQLIAIGAVLLVALLAAVLCLATPKPRISGNNSVSPLAGVATLTPESGSLCTGPVSVPEDTGSVRLVLGGIQPGGARVKMTTHSADRKEIATEVVTADRSGEVTFDLPPEAREDFALCWESLEGQFVVYGEQDSNINPGQASTVDGKGAAGDVSIAYIRTDKHSALSQVGTVFERAALFRPGWVGPWTYYAVFAIALLSLAGAIALLLLAGRRNRRVTKWMLAGIAGLAFVNAAMWALVTPAFQAPDEFAHFSYVETLAAGELPQKDLTPESPGGNSYTPSSVAISQVTTAPIIQRTFVKMPWSEAIERNAQAKYEKLRAGPDVRYGLTPANAYTPFYYAPAVVAYKLAGDGNIFEQLLLIRLWSALLLAIGVVFVALFVAEMLPRHRWAPVVAGLAVAFEPMVAHLGGSISNDNMMLAASASALWLAARVLRRGPTFWTVSALALAMVVDYAAKPTALGIAPAVAFAILFAIWRAPARLPALKTCLLAGVAPVALLGMIYVLFGPGGSVDLSDTIPEPLRAATPTGFLSYLWQWYLPAVGGMDTYWMGAPPAYRVFFGGFLADFNSLDTSFPNIVYVVTGAIAAALLMLVFKAVWDRRNALRSQWQFVAFPVIAIVGTVALINTTGYMLWVQDAQQFAQGRYLFPLLAIFGLYVAASGVGAGKRWQIPLTSAVVVALACINIAGMVLSLGRFYL